jgi:hypothetical protein
MLWEQRVWVKCQDVLFDADGCEVRHLYIIVITLLLCEDKPLGVTLAHVLRHISI